MFAARLYDGQTASARQVGVDFADNALVLRDGDSVVATWPVDDVRLAARPEAHSAGTLCLGDPGADGPRLAFHDPALATELILRNPYAAGLKPAERRRIFRQVAIWVVAAVVSLVVLVQVVIPAAATQAAYLIPAATERRVGAALSDLVVRQLALPSAARGGRAICATPAGNAALAELTARLLEGQETPWPVSVRVVDSPVANALALPGGHILLLRGLIAAAQDPDEVAGVVAHEMAHVLHRDPTAVALRRAATSFLAGLLFGDAIGVSVMGSVVSVVLGAAYTREAEAAADATALVLMRAAAIDGSGLARILERLEARQPAALAALPSYLSSHPPTAERARLAEGWPSRPALDEGEWRALRAICGGPERIPAR